jgi:hypothetical protein
MRKKSSVSRVSCTSTQPRCFIIFYHVCVLFPITVNKENPNLCQTRLASYDILYPCPSMHRKTCSQHSLSSRLSATNVYVRLGIRTMKARGCSVESGVVPGSITCVCVCVCVCVYVCVCVWGGGVCSPPRYHEWQSAPCAKCAARGCRCTS